MASPDRPSAGPRDKAAAPPRLILVRHAESEANRDRRSLGRADSPLTDRGRRQAAALGRAMAGQTIDRVVASPLRRAADTATSIAAAHDLAVEPDERLMEMDIGEMEGLGWAEARKRFGPFFERWTTDGAHTVPMPGGESLADVQARVWPVLQALRGLDRCTVIVSHNFVIRVLICRAMAIDLGRWRAFDVDLTSRTTLNVVGDQLVVHALNDTSHLAAGADA